MANTGTNRVQKMYHSSQLNDGMMDLIIELGIKMESTRKLNNFNFQWTKTLYQSSLFCIFQGL